MDSIKTVFSKIPSGAVAMTASALVLVAVAASLDNTTNTTVNVTESTIEETDSEDGSAPGTYYAGLNVNKEEVQVEMTEQSTASKEEIEEHIVAEPVEPEYVIEFTEEDYKVLCTIVEAEAGDQDDKGRILVANVIINRVKCQTQFPNNITDVVFANNGRTYQFSPVRPGGRYWKVTATEQTIACVDRALMGEDYSEGALYFCMQTSPDSWFNTSLEFLFKHQDHYFYK